MAVSPQSQSLLAASPRTACSSASSIKIGQSTGRRSSSSRRCKSGFARASSTSNAHCAPRVSVPIDGFSVRRPPLLICASVRQLVPTILVGNFLGIAMLRFSTGPSPEFSKKQHAFTNQTDAAAVIAGTL